MKRIPSVKTLSLVFDFPKVARAILEMSRIQLEELPAGKARIAECYHRPATYDVRLTCLNDIDSGLHGYESVESCDGEFAEYLNAGDVYTPALIYWRGRYRVDSLGDFIEKQERAGVKFK